MSYIYDKNVKCVYEQSQYLVKYRYNGKALNFQPSNQHQNIMNEISFKVFSLLLNFFQ